MRENLNSDRRNRRNLTKSLTIIVLVAKMATENNFRAEVVPQVGWQIKAETVLSKNEIEFERTLVECKMAETDFTSVYRQFFEEFAKTMKPEDPLPIRVPNYNLERDEMTGEVIESCIQYLTGQKCPPSLFVPIITIAVEEIQRELKKNPKNVHDPLKVMQMSTSKINDICLRYRDNEKLSSLPPPVKEQLISQHGVKHVRRQMEDRHVCLPRFNTLYNIKDSGEASYYGLFDGHRGTAAASFAVSHLHQFLAESQYYPHDPVSAFREAYQKTEKRYSCKEQSGGTTALAVLHEHEKKKLIVSWVGDSQAMLVRQEGYLMLVDPHRPDRKDESERISQLGGFIVVDSGYYRVNGQLAVSRAIGGGQWKPYVSAEPEIRVIDLTGSEEFLVIGCDGLWDVVDPKEVITAVYSQLGENPDNIESVSRRLIDLAKKNKSTDNISVIVVFFADPVEISKRSVEAIGPGPDNVSKGEMNPDFQTAAEKSPLVQLSDPGMNRIYEENGTHAEYMLQSKDDSDEDYGPETNIDTVDVLVPPKKCINPFSNNAWKEGEDCDDLVDYPKPDDMNMGKAINFSENMNNLSKENSESLSVEEEGITEPMDDLHVNQMNASNLVNIPVSDEQNITFSNFGFANKEFIDDTKFDKEIEKDAVDADHAFGTEKQDLFAVNNFSDFENFENKDIKDFEASPKVNVEDDAEKDLIDTNNEVLCNGNAEIYSNDKIDLEKLMSTLPPEPETNSEYQNITEDTTASDTNILQQSNDFTFETNIEPVQFPKEQEDPPISSMEKLDLTAPSGIEAILNIPHSPSDSENTSQKETETPELLSPTNLPLDEKLKDNIVADSGGEAESEDEGWRYIKVGSGAPAVEEVGLVLSPEPPAETEKPTMNSPLNPNAAEFVPVSPVPTPSETELQKTPIRHTPAVGDIIASSPNWNNMDCVDVPDEVAFLKEIRSRPSNIFLENDQSGNDLDGLGCNDLNLENKDAGPDLFQDNVTTESHSSENFEPQMEQYLQQSPVHGIVLANDMTSSFIDPSTMSSDNDMPKQEPELIEAEKEVVEPEVHATLNVDAVEFKFEPGTATEVVNKLPDLLSPLPVEEDVKQLVDTMPLASQPDTNFLDIDQSVSPVVESSPVLEKTPEIEIRADENVEIPTLQPEKVEIAEVPKVEEVPILDAVTPITPEPVSKSEIQDAPSAGVEVIGAAAASVAAATAAAVGSAAATKKDEIKKVTGTPRTSAATSKVMKSAATPKTPSSAKGVTPAKKPAATPVTKSAAAKPLSSTLSSPVSAKSTTSRVSSAPPKTSTTKPVTSNVTPRPLARKTAPPLSTTTTKTTTTTTPAKPLASKPATAPAKSALAPKVASTIGAPKPKPRVPSTLIEKKAPTTVNNESKTKRTEVLTKKPGIGSSTVTTTTRTTTTSRPSSAPIKSTTKTTSTVTTTRTTSTKPRTALTGVTSTTTTTTRTVLNSRKPLSATSKDVGNKPASKTVAKVNGLANGNANKTNKTTITSTTASKTNSGNKTETKAENIIDENVDRVENQVIENNKDINLINGIIHD